MKTSARDKVEGTIHEVKGQVKKAAGKVSNDPELTRKGEAEVLTGQAQKKVGQIKKVFEK